MAFIPQLVMFDLDGTLIDSVPDLALAVDRTLRSLALPLVGESRVREWVGNGAAKLIERALLFTVASEEEAARLQSQALDSFFSHYRQCCTERTCLYPKVKETLAYLHQRQIVMAIVTNKPREFVRPILLALGIEAYFTLVLGGDDLPNKKPHPQLLLHCMSELGFNHKQALMVGDSYNDIEAARAADVLVSAVNYGYNRSRPVEDEKPDFVLSNIYQIVSSVMGG